MAEHVQAALDQMVAPLRDLLDRNIFSESEIKAIVARRRESEYLLRRLTARKADFMRYIEAEMTLERLRELRTLQRKRDHRRSQQQQGQADSDNAGDAENKNKNKEEGRSKAEKQHIGDVHIVKHIHLLFVRAIRKFRSDLSLHLQHAEFCKEQKSYTRLGRVYAEALQIFPRQSGLWIEAASHEFFGPTRSIRNARVLLQRGLRLNEKSEELWMEYFSLELHYAQTLRGRRQILQLTESTEAATDRVETAKAEYKLPAIVLRNAMNAIPDSVHFRLQFMDVCKRFPDTEVLMDMIQQSMKADFASEPESWIARALYEAERQNRTSSAEEESGDGVTRMEKAAAEDHREDEDNDEEEDEERPSKIAKTTEKRDPVISVLEEAVDTLQSEEMLLQAFRFAEEYQKELEHRNADRWSLNCVEAFIQDLWRNTDGHDSPDLAMEHTNYLLNTGHADKALETIKTFCTSFQSTPAKAWILWAKLAPRNQQKGILERALQKLPMDRPDYMVILLQVFGAQLEADVPDGKLYDAFQRILLLAPKTVEDISIEDTGLEYELTSVFHAYLAYLMHSKEKVGIQGVRKVYTAVLFHSTVNLSDVNVEDVRKFLDTCLKFEQGACTVDKKRLRRLYDKAVEIFDGTLLEDVYRQDRNEKAVFS